MIDVYWMTPPHWRSLMWFSVCISLVLTSPVQRTYLYSSAGSNSLTTKLKLTPPNSPKQCYSQDSFSFRKLPHVSLTMRQWKLFWPLHVQLKSFPQMALLSIVIEMLTIGLERWMYLIPSQDLRVYKDIVRCLCIHPLTDIQLSWTLVFISGEK